MFINTYQLGVCYGDIGLQNCHSFTYPRLFLSDILYFVPRVQQFTCNNRRAEKDHQSIGSSQGLFSRKSFQYLSEPFWVWTILKLSQHDQMLLPDKSCHNSVLVLRSRLLVTLHPSTSDLNKSMLDLPVYFVCILTWNVALGCLSQAHVLCGI